jgi:hypothetical protein
MTDEPFTLANDKPKLTPWRPPEQEPCRQKVLFAGLDCEAGQLDIFATDGAPED